MPSDLAPRPALAWNLILRLLLAGALLMFCWSVVTEPSLQWDVRLRYVATQLSAHGQDPYNPAALAPLMQGRTITYVYPPDTLWLFRGFNVFGPVAAIRVYLALQLALFAALYFCWQRFFLPREDRASVWFAAFCVFGLGGTVLTDLRVGNISLLEQTLLWAGLAAFLRGRTGWFCVLLWLAAAFKLTLLVFSVLLLLGPVRHWGKFAALWGTMAARLALDALVSPALFHGFLASLARMGANVSEGGRNDPCLPEFLKDGVRLVLIPNDEGQVRLVAMSLYGLIALAVAALSWRAWLALRRRGLDRERDVLLICLVAAAYGLVVPRLKDYSCILLLLPVWRLARYALAGRPAGWLPLIFLACMSNFSGWQPLYMTYVFLWDYQVLLLLFTAWGLFVHAVLTEKPADGSSPPATPAFLTATSP